MLNRDRERICAETTVEMVDIPSGSYPIWRINGDNLRGLVWHRLKRILHLSKDLCTVAQYARFLENRRDMPVPRQRDVEWRRSGGLLDYARIYQDYPVTGMTFGEAQQYAEWFTEELCRIGIRGKARLPTDNELKVATFGPELRPLEAREVGPFGHARLVDVVWQWTNGRRNGEQLAFGRSATVAPKSRDQLLAAERAWPDLTHPFPRQSQFDQVGFRICMGLDDDSESNECVRVQSLGSASTITRTSPVAGLASATGFDVFLSYPSSDRKQVMRLTEALKSYGVKPWHDQCMLPGEPIVSTLDQVLRDIPAIAVCAGKGGFGSWQLGPEIQRAIRDYVKEGRTVIPVLLPSAPKKVVWPYFLDMFTVVRLDKSFTNDGLNNLVQSIKSAVRHKASSS